MPDQTAAMVALANYLREAASQPPPKKGDGPDPEVLARLTAAMTAGEPAQGWWADLRRAFMRFNTRGPQVRKRQVDTYLGDDPEALPEATDRPTSLTKYGDQPYKSVRKYLPHVIGMPAGVAGKDVDSLDYPMKLGVPGPGNPTVLLGSDYGGIGSRSLTNYLGLGNATTSLGKDEQGRPYLSVFDSWDFADDPLDKIFLKDLGRPFNVYDRIPITPGPGNTIPEQVDPFSKGDIELPPDESRKKRKKENRP